MTFDCIAIQDWIVIQKLEFPRNMGCYRRIMVLDVFSLHRVNNLKGWALLL